MLFKRAPKWVYEYPNDIHRKALIWLAKSSKGDFEKPREMNFVIRDLPPYRELEETKKNIQKAGWTCEVTRQEGMADKLVLTATRHDYSITKQNYARDTVFFSRLAEMYGGKYDGWFAQN